MKKSITYNPKPQKTFFQSLKLNLLFDESCEKLVANSKIAV